MVHCVHCPNGLFLFQTIQLVFAKKRNGDGYHGCFYKLLTLLYATVVTPDQSELTLLQVEVC